MRRLSAIWTVLGLVLALAVLLFLGDSTLAFVADQLRERRAYRLALERERTKQARIAHDRDTLTWQERELEHATSSEQAPEPAEPPQPTSAATAERYPRRTPPTEGPAMPLLRHDPAPEASRD